MLRANLSACCISKLFAALVLLLVLLSNPVFSDNQTIQNSHATIIAQNNQGITLSFELKDVVLEQVVENGNTKDSFLIPDEGYTYQRGCLKLPAVTRVVVVPPDAGLRFTFTTDEPRVVRAENPPVICNEEVHTENVDHERQPLTSVYPAVVAEMSEPFVVRGARMVRVTTYPVRYDPQTNTYLHYDNVRTQIDFTNDEAVNPAHQPNRRNRSLEFRKFIRNFAINGDEIGRDDPDRDREPEYVGHYLVVVQESCLRFAAEFIEWRRKSGWKVDILRVPREEALNPGVVKNLIQDVYDEYLDEGIDPFDQILLVGDHSDYDIGPNPQWVLDSDRGDPDWGGGPRHDDWFYACLEGGRNDEFADVGIARWCAGSPATLTLFSERTLSYEMTPFWENRDWFGRGAVLSQRWRDNEIVTIATNARWGRSVLGSVGFDDIRVYEDMNQQDWEGELIAPFVIEQFNDGVNVLLGRASNHHFRHGGFEDVDFSGIYPIDLTIGGLDP